MFDMFRRLTILGTLILIIFTVTDADFKCQRDVTTFVRTPGLRLPNSLWNNANINLPSVLLRNTDPTACYRKCLEDAECEGYFVNHEAQDCVILKGSHNFALGPVEQSSGWSYHRKVCLGGTARTCHRQWAFDRIPGVQLFDYDDKLLSRKISSRDTCLEMCSIESSFVCRSARFDPVNKTCVLSRHDRRTAPEAFRRSPHDHVEYLENQCITEPSRCMFHQHLGRALAQGHVHVQKSATTRESCEAACLLHSDFTCRSFEFDPEHSLCLLSPDDSHSFGVEASLGRPTTTHGRYFYERGSCIEVQMHCEATSMTATVKVITPFRGRMYALGHPYECYAVTVRANGEVALTMPLHGRKCGTKNLGNGTFVNSVVVQHHPFVLRNTDRRIDVACDYEEVQRKLRGGKQVLEGDLQSLTQVITGLATTPPIRLRIVNSSGQDVHGAQLGEQLYLTVEMADESIFGIFGTGLLARSGRGSETVMLIDDHGCPTEPAIFPVLLKSDVGKSLIAPFQAFKFASESTVKFQLTVSFCLDVCPPTKCEDESTRELNDSYGRKKRSRELPNTRSLELQRGDVVTDVTMESPMFVVSSGKSPPISPEDQQRNTNTHSDGIETVHLSNDSLCLSLPVLYTFAVVGGIIQFVFVIGSCVLLLIFIRKCRKYAKHSPSYITTSPSSSVRSKDELYPRS